MAPLKRGRAMSDGIQAGLFGDDPEAGAGTADPRARRLPLDLRWGVGQLPYPLGLSHGSW
jgi:hypothetical protein